MAKLRDQSEMEAIIAASDMSIDDKESFYRFVDRAHFYEGLVLCLDWKTPETEEAIRACDEEISDLRKRLALVRSRGRD